MELLGLTELYREFPFESSTLRYPSKSTFDGGTPPIDVVDKYRGSP
jgi:hypothetical protein